MYFPFFDSRSPIHSEFHVNRYLNRQWNRVGGGRADAIRSMIEGTKVPNSQHETLSFESTLNLKKGDEIWLEVGDKLSDAYLYDPLSLPFVPHGGGYDNQFIGYLLEENIALA